MKWRMQTTDKILIASCAVSLVLIFAVEAACRQYPSPLRRYRLHDGSVVSCRNLEWRNQGVSLFGCADGYQYVAQHNLVVLDAEKEPDRRDSRNE